MSQLVRLTYFIYFFAYQNVYAPDEDPNMQTIHYERDFEQNEMLGLNDMNTENYKDQNEDS